MEKLNNPHEENDSAMLIVMIMAKDKLIILLLKTFIVQSFLDKNAKVRIFYEFDIDINVP